MNVVQLGNVIKQSQAKVYLFSEGVERDLLGVHVSRVQADVSHLRLREGSPWDEKVAELRLACDGRFGGSNKRWANNFVLQPSEFMVMLRRTRN